jgi:hypothetical protein
MDRLYAALGGRKQTIGLLGLLMVVALGLALHASFTEIATAVVAVLGLTTGGHVVVDAAKAKAGTQGMADVVRVVLAALTAAGAGAAAASTSEVVDGSLVVDAELVDDAVAAPAEPGGAA